MNGLVQEEQPSDVHQMGNPPAGNALAFSVFDCQVSVACHDSLSTFLLQQAYGQLCLSSSQIGRADLSYAVGAQPSDTQPTPTFFLRRQGISLIAEDAGEFLFVFEKDMTITLQKLRRDLYFLHAAGLEWQDKTFLLVAASGQGKSTTTWALLHHGCTYLSDELAPIDLSSFIVQPYPHAVCLKAKPPQPYGLPPQTLYTERTLHIPHVALPSRLGRTPSPLSAIFFLQYCPQADQPSIRPMGKAEAATRVFAQALNPLAHPAEGLDGALDIVSQCACFELHSADLTATCGLVQTTLEGVS